MRAQSCFFFFFFRACVRFFCHRFACSLFYSPHTRSSSRMLHLLLVCVRLALSFIFLYVDFSVVRTLASSRAASASAPSFDFFFHLPACSLVSTRARRTACSVIILFHASVCFFFLSLSLLLLFVILRIAHVYSMIGRSLLQSSCRFNWRFSRSPPSLLSFARSVRAISA